MSDVQSGLEGVVAFATEIAEPDKEGGALRYRGVDIEDLVGSVPYEKVWGLLVDGSFDPGLLPAEPHPLMVRTGDPRVDVQSALVRLAPEWGLGQLLDISDEQARSDLARAAVMALSFVAQSARGVGQPWVPQSIIDEGATIAERFLIRWRGEADPAHVKAIDAYWISAAEHGMNASTFTARIVASTGADVAAALSSAVGVGRADRDPQHAVALVNAAFVRAVFPDRDPLGQQVTFARGTVSWTVVGVVGDVRQRGLASEVRPELYAPVAITGLGDKRLFVSGRDVADPLGLVPALREAIRRADPDLSIDMIGTGRAVLTGPFELLRTAGNPFFQRVSSL